MVMARLDLRLDEKTKAKAEKASALLGMKSLSEYVVSLMEEDASQVIAEHERMIIKDDLFDRFINACEQAKAPNKALLEAAAFSKAQGIK